MIKSKEIIGPSCLTSAADDEPIFVLRANDEIAPKIVRAWALEYHNSKCEQNFVESHTKGLPEHKWELTAKQAAKYQEANALADQMKAWKASRIEAEESRGPRTDCAVCGGSGCDRCIPDEFASDGKVK